MLRLYYLFIEIINDIGAVELFWLFLRYIDSLIRLINNFINIWIEPFIRLFRRSLPSDTYSNTFKYYLQFFNHLIINIKNKIKKLLNKQ